MLLHLREEFGLKFSKSRPKDQTALLFSTKLTSVKQWSTGTEISSRPGPARDSLHPGRDWDRDRDWDKNKIPAGTRIRVIPAGTGTGNFASKIEPFLTYYRTITTFHEFMQFEIIHVRYI